jgi:thioredoxin:protein disulfide reductase
MTARHLLHALLALLSLSTGAAVAQDQDVLPPEQVFQYTTASDAQRVYLKFAILDGYYLYRSRFGFDTSTPGVALSAAEFPKGEIHSDEYFGEQEIYRGKFEIAIPYRRSAVAGAVALELRLQGCADRGLCYIPQSWDADIELPAANPLLGAQEPANGAVDDLLPVAEAFVMNARFDKPQELTVAWQIAPNYYLYRDKLTFEVDGRVELGRATLPKGKAHRDENFGDVEVFYDYVEAKVPFSRASPAEIDVVVTGGFQGCKDESICYPPGAQTMSLVLPATADFPASAVTTSSSGGDGPVSEQDQWASRIVNGSYWQMLGWFFVAGLALSLTPCVLPMVPILSSIIAGQKGTVSASRGFMLSVSYVLGMAATYSRGRARGARGRPDSGDVPETLDHQSVRRHVLRAVPEHVRRVRAADADDDPNAALAAR